MTSAVSDLVGSLTGLGAPPARDHAPRGPRTEHRGAGMWRDAMPAPSRRRVPGWHALGVSRVCLGLYDSVWAAMLQGRVKS